MKKKISSKFLVDSLDRLIDEGIEYSKNLLVSGKIPRDAKVNLQNYPYLDKVYLSVSIKRVRLLRF